MQAVETVAPSVGIKPACEVLGISRATLYRRRTSVGSMEKTDKSSPRALSAEEKQQVLDRLHSDRFLDKAPREVYATLLDPYHVPDPRRRWRGQR